MKILSCVAVVLLVILTGDAIGKQNLKNVLQNTKEEKLIITTTPIRKSGITKRAILIGNKVCGKGGLVETDSLKASKREEIDFDSLRKDLHPDQYNSTQVISEKPPGPTQVISKVSNKRLWFERLNRCCMDHEDCNRFIPAKQERYNYRNDREYTVYDCKCDDSFAECLKYADSYTADAVGDLYFNVLKMPCINFSEDGNGTTAVDTSKNILDKVNEILAKKPGKKITKDGKEIAATLEGLQDMKEGGKPGPVSLRKLDDQSDAKERQARHFNRNGHQ